MKPNNKKQEVKQEPINVRYHIYRCLYNIYYYEAFSNIEVDHAIRENKLNDMDAKLLTNIVYGTISHDKSLRWIIKKLSDKEPKKEAIIILLMSLYQLYYLDKVPPFAIVHEAVSLAKRVGGDAMGKFVNAILREAQRQNIQITADNFKDNYEYLSMLYNVPAWLIKMLETHYGKNITLKVLECNQKEAPLAFRVNTNVSSVSKLLDEYDYFSKGKLAKNSLIYTGFDSPTSILPLKNGEVSIQDESSQYVVEVLDPQDGERMLDMCAAPGSKTTYIATLAKNSKILAIDIHEHRVNLMKNMLKTLKIDNVTCVTFDSTNLSSKEKLVGSFDKVLLDAPCLGVGVIRRKPDIALTLSGNKLDELNRLQAKLLEQAYLMLKPGGTLVYSTCSINKKENDFQILSFISLHSDMKRVYEKQIFPYEYDSDGFYICKMIKEPN